MYMSESQIVAQRSIGFSVEQLSSAASSASSTFPSATKSSVSREELTVQQGWEDGILWDVKGFLRILKDLNGF